MKVFLVEPDEFIAKKLQGFLARAGFGATCQVIENSDKNSNDGAVVKLDSMTRLGVLLDRIRHVQGAEGTQFLQFGDYRLDLLQGELECEQGEAVRLTEKEVLLLKILIEAGGESVSRETLLDKVWGYADGVETHTLETHIYRLRQKIEKDPAAPEIIKTDESAGYYLAV